MNVYLFGNIVNDSEEKKQFILAVWLRETMAQPPSLINNHTEGYVGSQAPLLLQVKVGTSRYLVQSIKCNAINAILNRTSRRIGFFFSDATYLGSGWCWGFCLSCDNKLKTLVSTLAHPYGGITVHPPPSAHP